MQSEYSEVNEVRVRQCIEYESQKGSKSTVAYRNLHDTFESELLNVQTWQRRLANQKIDDMGDLYGSCSRRRITFHYSTAEKETKNFQNQMFYVKYGRILAPT